MRTFDFHVHVWEPSYIPDAIRWSWAAHAAYRSSPPRDPDEIFPKVTRNVSDPGAVNLLAAMEALGVERAAIMAVDYGIGAGEESPVPITAIHDTYAEIVRSSNGRLSFFASIDPRRPGGVDLAAHALDDLGAVGLKMYPPSGFEPGDPSATPFYDLLVDRAKPVVFHVAVVHGALASRYSWPILVTDVQRRHPSLPIVLAHAGYPCWWNEAVAVTKAHPRTYLELSLWQKAAADDWDTFVDMLHAAKRAVGADRILFASDSMFGTEGQRAHETEVVGRWISQIASLADDARGRFSKEEVELILWGNAAALLSGSPA